MLTPEKFTRALADPTRLRILMLIMHLDELCVCQLTAGLGLVQPKISRHLAVLRELDILLDRRKGLWKFYRLHPKLPEWSKETLQGLSAGCIDIQPYVGDLLEAQSPDNNVSCLTG